VKRSALVTHRASAVLLLLLLRPLTAGAFDSVDDARRWAITGVNVLDLETGEIASDRAIVIQSGVIEAVEASGSLDLDSVDLVVNLKGRYAMPGLWDSHVHLRGGPSLIEANERWLPQYLGFGVTTVRDAGGDLPSSVLHWKAEIEQGTLRGPRIYSALRKIDGVGDRQPGSIAVGSKAEIDAALDYLTLAGADFVKVYDFSLPRSWYVATIREAEARGLKTAAHVPPWVPFEEAVDAGLDSVEHAFYLTEAANPDDRRVARSLENKETSDYLEYFRTLTALGRTVDPRTARRVFALMVRKGTAVVSTLQFDRLEAEYLSGEYEGNPRERETPAPILETHDQALLFFDTLEDGLLDTERALTEQVGPLLKMAADAGVTVMAGSDTGANNPLLYPGDSLHGELEALVTIGLPPLEALRSATVNPARWMGVYPKLGSITPGAAADIVILESNPLDDIANARALAAVVQQGVYFDADELVELRTLRRD
jgi:imidazolonepropionase-like amidohydrolase